MANGFVAVDDLSSNLVSLQVPCQTQLGDLSYAVSAYHADDVLLVKLRLKTFTVVNEALDMAKVLNDGVHMAGVMVQNSLDGVDDIDDYQDKHS